jgi:hypothetical protein
MTQTINAVSGSSSDLAGDGAGVAVPLAGTYASGVLCSGVFCAVIAFEVDLLFSGFTPYAVFNSFLILYCFSNHVSKKPTPATTASTIHTDLSDCVNALMISSLTCGPNFFVNFAVAREYALPCASFSCAASDEMVERSCVKRTLKTAPGIATPNRDPVPGRVRRKSWEEQCWSRCPQAQREGEEDR